MMLQPGQEFAHFRIMRELGAGGMGAVYLAEDLKLHREVALKIILAEYFNDAERLGRFQREAKMAARIAHPNVMGIYDIGSAPDPDTGRDLEYIVMERVKGIPLGEYFQSAKPDMGGVIRVASRIAAGLAAAHKLNIAHRDIKASNILVDDEGNPKILDFGLAKPVDPVQFDEGDRTDTVSQELTRAGKIVGTVSYMSPEQARGDAVDIRTDIFSFGVLLYRMATGEFPFAGQSQVTTLAKILESKHEPPRLKNQQIPTELERIIDKCLQKDPNDRYPSAADLTVDLRNLRRQFDSGVTESISGEYRVERTVRVGGKRLAAIAAGLVVVGIVAVIVWRSGGERPGGAGPGGISPSVTTPGGNAVAVFDFENKTGDTSLNWLQTGLPEILMTDLAQTGSITVISRERVLDHLRTGSDLPDADEISDDVRAEIEQARDEIREAVKSGSLDGVPAVKDALELARVSVAGLMRPHTYAEMAEAAGALGASTVLSGSFFKLGERIRIDARLEDIGSGKIVLAEKVMGNDPFALVDSLTGKIVASLNVKDQMADQSVANVITGSPEAYRLYREGMDLFGLGMNDEAIAKFEAAAGVDSAFALAYMRIAMVHVFEGRLQKGMQYLARADAFKESLPVRERSLLDIYTDLWLEQELDAAFVKLRAYVENYPSDKEARVLFGLATWVFNQDTAAARAQYDTVLRADPVNLRALAWTGDLLRQSGQLDSAVYYYRKVKAYHPDSPEGYTNLGALYREQGDIPGAAQEYLLMSEAFPRLAAPWMNLSTLAIRQRDFEGAGRFLDEYRGRTGKDPYGLYEYEMQLSGLEQWRGQFRSARDHMRAALDYARQTKDSNYVRSAYNTLFSFYRRLHMDDSALWCARQTEPWSTGIVRLNVAMNYAEAAPADCGRARAFLEEGTAAFKQRVPSGLWPVAEAVGEAFDGYCAGDTAAVIAALLKLSSAQQPGQGEGNRREAGVLQVLTGHYREGRDILVRSLSGKDEVASGATYPYFLYLVGVAEQELGDTKSAIARFEEMLRYWGKPDIETKEIADARRRLAALRS